MYSVKTNAVQQSISRFKKTAYSGCIRRDGKLVVAGSEDNSIQVILLTYILLDKLIICNILVILRL